MTLSQSLAEKIEKAGISIDDKWEPGDLDVIQGVGALVVVRVERLVRRPAPQLGLLRRLLVLGAGEQPARRNTGQREPVVIGPAVERSVLWGLAD